jgi:hypothetical protein
MVEVQAESNGQFVNGSQSGASPFVILAFVGKGTASVRLGFARRTKNVPCTKRANMSGFKPFGLT